MKNKNVTYKTLESKEFYKKDNSSYNLELKESSDKDKDKPRFLGITKNTKGENDKIWINYKPSFPLDKEFFVNLEKVSLEILKKYPSENKNSKDKNLEKIRLLEEKIKLLEGK